jgi:hypothetical protein
MALKDICVLYLLGRGPKGAEDAYVGMCMWVCVCGYVGMRFVLAIVYSYSV